MTNKYFYPNTNVHVNVKGITDKAELKRYTAKQFGLSMIKIEKNPIKINSTYDMLKLHKILFEHVFYWAGDIRDVNIQRSEFILGDSDVVFSDYKNIRQELRQLDSQYIHGIQWKKLSKYEFIEYLCQLIVELWVVHPFVEGNTRTIIVFMDQFVRQFGYYVDIDKFNATSEDIRNAFVWAYIGEFLHIKRIISEIVIRHPQKI